MNEVRDELDQGRVMRRLEAMGIRVRRLSGGRCVLASMPIDGPPLETLNGSLPFNEFVFSTVGRDKIKCLRPQALFVLPLIRIISCTTAASLEAHVRSIWAKYMVELRAAEDWLRGLGADVNAASTDDEFSVDSVQSCDMTLSELGQNFEFDAQVIYQMNDAGERGVGLQFLAMSSRNEARLIEYLHCLH